MKTKKRILSILLSLVMVLGLMPGMSLTAMAKSTSSDWETPLTLEAITDEATVTVKSPKSGMKYSIDGGKTKKTVTNNSPINLQKGGTVTFYGNGTNIKRYYTNDDVYTNILVSSGQCCIYGNVMSLVDETGFAANTALPGQYTFRYLFEHNGAMFNHSTRKLVLPATTLQAGCYYAMFLDCSSLTEAPDLPATTLAGSCYREMFYGCSSLTKAPDLPATTLATRCYQEMFYYCTSLAEAPDLPATTLKSYCYDGMFYNCTSLTEAPVLPAATLVTGCYSMMFDMDDVSSSLNAVTCLATDISASNSTYNWLGGVTATGTFTKAVGMNNWIAESISGIPEGWTVKNYAEKKPDTVTLSTSTATLDVDDTVVLNATVGPKDTTDKKVKWSVNNSNVKLYTNHTCTTEVGTDATTLLTVYARGISVGSATVTATSNADSTKFASCAMTVNESQITYTVEANGAVATVKDSTPEQNTYTAELTGLPQDKLYDGWTEELTATVQKSYGFPSQVEIGEISFKDQNNNAVTLARNVGTYTASVTVGDQTINKAYRISGRTPSISYDTIGVSGGNLVISRVTTDQYVPLQSNPNGLAILLDGATYVVSGDVQIGAMLFVGDVTLLMCKDSRLTVYAGIWHIGSTLEIYDEVGGENAVLDVQGTKTLSDLDLSELNKLPQYSAQDIAGTDASMSGTIRVYGSNLSVAKGNHTNLFADDISITVGKGMAAKGTTNEDVIVDLTGGTANSDGSVTFRSANLANLKSLSVTPIIPVTSVTLPATATLTVDGDAVALTATIEPSTATDKTVKWSVSNSNVKLYTDETCTTEVSSDATENLTVYAKGISAGEAIVTVTSNGDGTKSDTCTVTVNAATTTGAYADLVNTTTVVTFDGKDWYLIEDNSTAVDAGTVTLLAKECVAASKYNESGSFVDYSNNPTVKTAVDTYYTNSISADAKTAVSGSAMFLLTTDQATNTITNEEVRKCSQASGAEENYWWLCSQGRNVDRAACVSGGSGYVSGNGRNVTDPLGVRPALKLNLSSVIFSSESKSFTLKPAHTHSFNYSANGATITATCGAGCDITEGLTLTISAPTGELTYDGTTAYEATLSTGYNATAFPGEYNISYTKDGAAYSGTPKDAGNYVASVTAGTGDKAATASVSFTIKKADSKPSTVAANNRDYDGTEQPLVTVTGEPTGGEMQYALGTATEATEQYTTSIPTGTEAGTYYVWYMAKGDENHNNSEVDCIPVTITATYTVTYKVVNGTWSDGTTADKTETVQRGSKPASVPTGMIASSGYTGGAWNTNPADAAITEATTFTYTFSAVPTYTVTYKVVNGTWSDGTTADKTETVQSGSTPASVPTGMIASSGYTGGAWNTNPADAAITEATTFTYTFSAVPTYTVTYKVVNGTWSDGTTADKTETVQSGSKPASVPTGMIASSGYTGGAWNTNPADVTITEATTFTYTFSAVPTYTVTYKVVNGTWSDGTTADKTETVQSGSKPASVPTGMIASSGYTSGAWNTNPADATITEATTFTYTFTQTPAVYTDESDPNQNHRLHEGNLIFTIKRSRDDQDTFSLFDKALVDNNELTLNVDYTKASGSLILTLKAAYLDTLALGEHTLTVLFTDGRVDSRFTVSRALDPTNFDDVAVPSDSFTFKVVWQGGSDKDIDFTLYRKGGTVYRHGFDKQKLGSGEWQYSAWFSSPEACYVLETPMKGYRIRYENTGVYAQVTDRCCDGGTIIIYKVPKTGDTANLALWMSMVVIGGMTLCGVAVLDKRRKQSQK